jgi:hypothetical protein
MPYIYIMIVEFFENLRSRPISLKLRKKISAWPGYQHVPLDLRRSYLLKLRILLSLVSETLRMDRETKRRIHQTRKLKGSVSGDVLIIGNGPSSLGLTKAQLHRFRQNGGKIAVMNSFYRTNLATAIEPDYYFVGDPEYWNPTNPANKDFRSDFRAYVEGLENGCFIVQPANQSLIVEDHPRVLFLDFRSVAGLRRIARPDKPWGLPSSIAMIAIATMRFFGHKTIFFSGLDSNMHNYFFINHRNEILFDTNEYYSYSSKQKNSRRQELNAPGVHPMYNEPIRHMADLLYAQAIFFRDLYWLCKKDCVNVGNDETNDAAPRACLIP